MSGSNLRLSGLLFDVVARFESENVFTALRGKSWKAFREAGGQND